MSKKGAKVKKRVKIEKIPLYKAICLVKGDVEDPNDLFGLCLDYPSCIFYGTSVYEIVVQHCQWKDLMEHYDPEINKQILQEKGLYINYRPDYDDPSFNFIITRSALLEFMKEKIKFLRLISEESKQLLEELEILNGYDTTLAEEIFPRNLLKNWIKSDSPELTEGFHLPDYLLTNL